MSENLTVLPAREALQEIESLVQSEAFTQALERLQSLGRPELEPAEMVRLHHLHGVALARLGRGLEAAGRFRKSLEAAEGCQDAIGQARATEELGAIHHQERRLAEAQSHYERALRLWGRLEDREGEARSHRNLGNLFADFNDQARASEAYETSRALYLEIGQPDEMAASVIHAASLRYQSEGLDAAVQEYARGLDQDGCRHHLVTNNYGFLLMLQGQLDRALEVLQQARKDMDTRKAAEDDLALVHLNLGLVHAMRAELEPAEKHLRQSAELLERHPEARAVEILLLVNDRWQDQGFKPHLVVDNGQKRALAHLNLAAVLTRAGRIEEAHEQLRIGQELERSAAYPFLAAGWIHLTEGHEKAATEAFRRAHGMAPDNDETRRALDLVNPYLTMKVGRNDPCPCGSGKKFKKCHGA
jgi:tetratricopeptide (TPR) repeat protein